MNESAARPWTPPGGGAKAVGGPGVFKSTIANPCTLAANTWSRTAGCCAGRVTWPAIGGNRHPRTFPVRRSPESAQATPAAGPSGGRWFGKRRKRPKAKRGGSAL